MKPKSIPDETSRRRHFKRRLLMWFRRHGRDLPWRRTRDPYQILVSEVMLQQTQVTRVTEYWPRFLERFPTLDRLAAAPPAQVREAWSGLGYYRRAENLHRLARTVTRDHGGTLPRDPAALRTLPGIGPYTAGAVASFAWELPEPAIDTNVHRVLRRVFHPRVGTNARGLAKLTRLARALVPRAGNDAWATNQALMELGALVCTARVMRCESCPVWSVCKTTRYDGRGTRDASPRPVQARS